MKGKGFLGFKVQWGDTEIGTLCKDNAHTVANFDTLPSVGKLLLIYEILEKKKFMSTTCVPQFKARRLMKKKIFKIY